MAKVQRVRRLVNPRPRRKSRRKNAARSAHRRRRLTAAQIAAGFGGKRAQSGQKAARKRKRKVSAAVAHRRNPRRAAAATHRRRKPRVKVVYRTRTKIKYRTRKATATAKANPKRRRRSTRRRSNPYLVTLGPVLNPTRKRRGKKRSSATAMAKHRKRRKVSMSSHRHHRRRNPGVKVVYRTRRRARRHVNSRRRRNPVSFGSGHGAMEMTKAVVAGLVGVTVTKKATSMLSGFTSSSPLMNVVVSVAVAWGTGFLASKLFKSDRAIGDAVMFGGFMQAGSVALNQFLPSVGGAIGLSGLTPSNDILLPYNPFAGRGAMVSAGSPGSMRSPGGGAGFTPAFA